MKRDDPIIMSIAATVGWRNDVVRLAEQQGLSVSQMMRRAMEQYATKHGVTGLDEPRPPRRGRRARVIQTEE